MLGTSVGGLQIQGVLMPPAAYNMTHPRVRHVGVRNVGYREEILIGTSSLLRIDHSAPKSQDVVSVSQARSKTLSDGWLLNKVIQSLSCLYHLTRWHCGDCGEARTRF